MKTKKIIYILPFFLMLSSFVFSKEYIERNWLKKEYLPKLEGKILFVGLDHYNSEYYKLVKTPKSFETLEIIPERAKWGSPYKHHTCDFLKFDPGYKYDHICLFGIMGRTDNKGVKYNIDNNDAISECLMCAHKLLKVGGTLQLGPDCVWVPKYNANFWFQRFKQNPLDLYQVITNTKGNNNMLWWGKKLKE